MARIRLFESTRLVRDVTAMVGHDPGSLGSAPLTGKARSALKYYVRAFLGKSRDFAQGDIGPLREAYDSVDSVAFYNNYAARTIDYVRRLKVVEGAADTADYEEAEADGDSFTPATGSSGYGHFTPVPTPAPVPTKTPAQPDVATAALQKAIALIMASVGQSCDESAVRAIVKQELSGVVHPTRVVVENRDTGKTHDCGVQHKQFPTLLKMVASRLPNGNRRNVWLAGPAGTGKTSAAEAVAKALGLPFHFNGAIDSEYKLLGFTDANGRVVCRPFREAYESGGVYLFDEVDRSMQGALLASNAALANGVCDFPDKTISRHPDCVIIAAANTWGLGGNSDYVGAMKHDAAFLDRFCFLEWDLDPTFERSLCIDSAWCDYVQRVRANARIKGLKVVISPRASIEGAALLRDGVPRETVIAAYLKKGMSPEQWASIA